MRADTVKQQCVIVAVTGVHRVFWELKTSSSDQGILTSSDLNLWEITELNLERQVS